MLRINSFSQRAFNSIRGAIKCRFILVYFFNAILAQWLVHLPSKQRMTVRFCYIAPKSKKLTAINEVGWR